MKTQDSRAVVLKLPGMSSSVAAVASVPNRLLPGCSAIILREDGKILIQRRSDNGLWGLPGGAVEMGETISDATVREVREETGLEIEVQRLLGLYSDPATQVVAYADGNVVHYVSASFLCRVIGGEPTVTEESTELVWSDPLALPQPFVPSQRIRVDDWLVGNTAPVIR